MELCLSRLDYVSLFIIYLFRNYHPPRGKKQKQDKNYKNNIKLDEGLANGLVFPARQALNKVYRTN